MKHCYCTVYNKYRKLKISHSKETVIQFNTFAKNRHVLGKIGQIFESLSMISTIKMSKSQNVCTQYKVRAKSENFITSSQLSGSQTSILQLCNQSLTATI